MTFADLIAATRPSLAVFDYDHYPASFSAFEEQAAPLWAAAEAAPEEAAAALISALEERRLALPRREQRSAAQEEKQVLALFLSPAALRRGEGGRLFARELQRQWVARYPRNPYSLGSYESLMKGFDANLLGLPLRKSRQPRRKAEDKALP